MPYPTQETLREIRELFDQFGREPYYGEEVSQFEHAAQAAELARRDGYDEEVQLAAFLHDIGHMLPVTDPADLMEEYGRRDHESAASDWLQERGFSQKVGTLIENHVNAKRYLTYKYPEYLRALSHASLQTLRFQGGPMPEAEATAFEQNPHFGLIIRMRRWDEAAKMTDYPTPDLGHYLAMAERYLEA
ncbi:HD domain-containing protein [Rhabdobacter roseus]|uniref:Phosphonate degradation associated HDIG domain protein n=1 Tax=Rhabdobacter roseus TaxID=1655419 RepID=A0A840U1N1_9BACT|nr:HDIG domain-containing metalloprotein [Rhabdobacter roseus]MBB5286040.1 phosphonate degradation associated HDIG domain protein [Rhabdobacter roseus]